LNVAQYHAIYITLMSKTLRQSAIRQSTTRCFGKTKGDTAQSAHSFPSAAPSTTLVQEPGDLLPSIQP